MLTHYLVCRIQTRVVFIPNIISDSLSIPRQIAYKDGLWKPGSKDDIRWTSTPPLILRGVFEGEEQVVRYTVRIPSPAFKFNPHFKRPAQVSLANPVSISYHCIICEILIGSSAVVYPRNVYTCSSRDRMFKSPPSWSAT